MKLSNFWDLYSKKKVRGLFGYWTEALYSLDYEHYEAFLKQQKKEAKNAAKHPQAASAADPDEELPDVDPTHEQLNLPPNSITLWRSIPKLEYSSQVTNFIS